MNKKIIYGSIVALAVFLFAPYNKAIGTFTGKQLIENGIDISLTTPYSGTIIKVEKIQ